MDFGHEPALSRDKGRYLCSENCILCMLTVSSVAEARQGPMSSSRPAAV